MLPRILIICACVSFSNLLVYACSCYGTPTVNSEYAAASIVMIARVDSGVDKNPSGIFGAYLVVEKVFKGTISPSERLFFRQGGGGDCTLQFNRSRDKRLLLYSKMPDGGIGAVWSAGICGRNRLIEDAADDLLFLNDPARVRGKTRISGMLRYFEDNDTERPQSKQIAGHAVKITGNGRTWTAVTNADGVYEFIGLPPGIYEIKPDPYPRTFAPFGWRLTDYFKLENASPRQKSDEERLRSKMWKDVPNKPVRHEVLLLPGGSAGYDFDYDSSNTVEGRVLGPDGKPLESADITFIREDGTEPDQRIEQTDALGRYAIPRLAPGKYFIAVNQHGFIKADNPFPPVYYPGVRDLKYATIITLRGGERVTGIDIMIPEMHPTVWVSGQVVYADGSPVDEADVKFVAVDEPEQVDGDSEMRTSKDGRFRIKVLKGLRGTISAEKRLWGNDFANCVGKIFTGRVISESGVSTEVGTELLPITPDADIPGLVLRFPFNNCGKK